MNSFVEIRTFNKQGYYGPMYMSIINNIERNDSNYHACVSMLNHSQMLTNHDYETLDRKQYTIEYVSNHQPLMLETSTSLSTSNAFMIEQSKLIAIDPVEITVKESYNGKYSHINEYRCSILARVVYQLFICLVMVCLLLSWID
jgi:hypothetical protein